jgi:undecaprenyl-phosphate 4-deoxy-4-formamido-L-arabinose transferase
MAASLSIVVPVFNSEKALPLLLSRLSGVIGAQGWDAEIILVNDGSTDASWERICELATSEPRLRPIDLIRNYGQHNALLCGIRAAQGEVVVTLDDDLQNPPEEIPRLLAMLREGYDVVYGAPVKEQHGLLRDLASQITKFALQSAMGAQTARQVSAFRAFRTRIRDAFVQYQGPYVSIDVLLTWGTSRFTAIQVQHDPRTLGESNYRLGRLVVHAFNMITGFSTLPLRVASLVGFVFAAFGGLVLVYVIGRYILEGTPVPGFPFLASVIAVFSGAQLFALGVMGEYLARMHFRLMDRPTYVVRREPSQIQK